jgi:hypothetical protein
MATQTPQKTSRLTHTLPLSEFYQAYVLGGKGGPTNYTAVILGYKVHTVEQNKAWSQLYRVFVFEGREIIKLRCLGSEKVTVIYRG